MNCKICLLKENDPNLQENDPNWARRRKSEYLSFPGKIRLATELQCSDITFELYPNIIFPIDETFEFLLVST